MYFRIISCIVMLVMSLSACTSYKRVRQMRTGELMLGLSVREDSEYEEPERESVVDSVAADHADGPIIMNAIRDSDTGEMVATDVISASKVTARFRNVAERDGYVTISFEVRVPGMMMDSKWRLKIIPTMRIASDTLTLQPLYITGKAYRNAQLKGYQRYQAFLASIITDTTDMLRMRQLEIFIQRHFPLTYRMKNDSSIISQPMAENLFGVTQIEALRHYTRHWKVRRNEWKKKNRQAVFRRYVKDPIIREGVRLDTVMTTAGDFIYQYNHTFRSRPGLKKVMLNLDGKVYEDGECILELPFPQDLTFYISSLASLADTTTRYKMMVLERAVSDHTKALIDFDKGSSVVDTLRGCNASELRRVLKCVEDVDSRTDLLLDSLVITASCSPEGAYKLNRSLSIARSKAVLAVLEECMPEHMRPLLRTSCMAENWSQMSILIKNDTILTRAARDRIDRMMQTMDDLDRLEYKLSSMPEYKYLREKIYPQLRSVSFDFYLHRKGMIKDTVHTTVVDSVYMSAIDALKTMDYQEAVRILRPYADYNAALAYVSSGYNHSALNVLESLSSQDPKVLYLMAMVLSRLEKHQRALDCFGQALELAPALEFRANLDPEMSELVKKWNKTRKYDEF